MQIDVKQCPTVDWFLFKQKCPITTCKYHNTQTTHCCMAIDHKFPSGDRIISDSELLVYKFAGENTDVRSIAAMRKRGLTDIRFTVILYHFIEYIRSNYIKDKYKFVYYKGTNQLLDKLFARSNLRFKKLGFESWMLPLVVDDAIWTAFRTDQKIDDKVGHNCLLLLRPKEFENFAACIKTLAGSKTLFSQKLPQTRVL